MMCVCVCVCVCARARACVCVCVRACVFCVAMRFLTRLSHSRIVQEHGPARHAAHAHGVPVAVRALGARLGRGLRPTRVGASAKLGACCAGLALGLGLGSGLGSGLALGLGFG